MSLTILMASLKSNASYSCYKTFSGPPAIMSNQVLRFSQSFIGRTWASQKRNLLLNEYYEWRTQNPRGELADFVLWHSQMKPMVVVRDVNGRIVLVDKHNSLYNYTLLIGKGTSFQIHTKMKKDYLSVNSATGRLWTEKEMMNDLIKNNWVDLQNGQVPSYRDLLSLPRNIIDLNDSPMRSFISFLFSRFETPLKGSDFLPHIQNQLKSEFERLDMTPFRNGQFTTSDVIHFKNKVLESPEVIQFLLSRLNPELSPERAQLVRDTLSLIP